MTGSRWVDLDGPVHLEEYDGPETGPTFVMVHGLGGHHVNWRALAPSLAARGRVLVPDLAGFGRTPLAGRRASVEANRELVHRLIEHEVRAPVVLVGNSMGGLITILEAATEPDVVAGAVLIDPALPRALSAGVDRVVASTFATYMIPKVGERFIAKRLATVGPDEIARETLALCTVDPSRVPGELVAAQLELARERAATMPWATTAFLDAARSLVRMLARRGTMKRTIAAITAPVLMLMGRQDRLVPISSADAVAASRPDWDYVVFDDCGHVPMMEYPAETAHTIDTWLDGPAARLIGSARATG